jgi:hypothetical protein
MPLLQEHNIQTQSTYPTDLKQTMPHFPAERMVRGVELANLVVTWEGGCIHFHRRRDLFVEERRVVRL